MDSPILIIGCGNPSRGDDALGPELLRLLEQDRDCGRISASFDTLTDFQFQIEHALDLQGRDLALFVDAGMSVTPPFEFSHLEPRRDDSYTTHALSPAAVLSVYERVVSEPMPLTFLLVISGYGFELGDALSENAAEHLRQAERFVLRLLDDPDPDVWCQLTTGQYSTL